MKENETNNFFDSPRMKALIKLILYLLFFVVLISTSLNYKSTDNDDIESSIDESSSSTIKVIDYNELKTKLLLNKYEFKFDIYKDDTLTTEYSGTRNESYFAGTKMADDEYTKFSIVDGKIYEIKLNTMTESNKVFESIDLNFIDSEYILNYVNSFSPIISDSISKKVYKYTIDNKYEIVINMDVNSIYEIDVLFIKTNIKYVMIYS